MKITYFLNFYPTKHKIVAHDEMMEMTKRGHKITVIAAWGGERNLVDNLHFEVIYLENTIIFMLILRLATRYREKIIQHLKLLKKHLGFRDALRYFLSYGKIIKCNPDRIHAHFATKCSRYSGIG